MLFRSINAFVALIAGLRFGPDGIVRFSSDVEVKSFKSASTPNAVCVSMPLLLQTPSRYFENADNSTGEWLPHAVSGDLPQSAVWRLEEAGYPQEDYMMHLGLHVHMHTETPHSIHAVLGSRVIKHHNLISAEAV